MKTEIKNRKGQKIVVLVELAEKPKGLVFVMHGLGGFKEQKHIQTFADAFKEKNYSVIRFDTTNSIGESDGKYEDATVTSSYEDLEDVINWAKKQAWYQKPFCMASHSLGSICVALYAENYPEEVKALAPTSTVVSGKLTVEARPKEAIEKWRRTGWLIKESESKPGIIKKTPWSHMEDRLKYDLLERVDKLAMPVLLIVGEKDSGTPPEHQKILFDKLPGKKEMHIIKGASHTFREKKHLDEIKQIFLDWLDKI